ncbi:hypothetical protein O6H91_04G047700 [Diphasiastrum complanatum]|uniref:Uncharacterized protein n=1 Tax=Diphasiastrum complanatum TaxID=34168 RepID=A0ACC2DWQ1_DIPCM|nr:hypothetical protein O6H91_04G047700 [Diphasiastrum complanatum]
MPGKRSRPMQRTLSTMSLCHESAAAAEVLPPPKEAGEKQGLMKICPPAAVRQIIGFNPTAPLGNDEEMPADLAHVKLTGPSKPPRPYSGLESLLCTTRLSDSNTHQSVISIVDDVSESVQSPKKHMFPKQERVHTTVGRVHELPLSPWSDHHSTVFRGNSKHSHPIPICQSSKLQKQLSAQVQEPNFGLGHNRLPSDGPVRRHGGLATALPSWSAHPLRSFVQECVFGNEVENYDFGVMLESLPDQSEGADSASFAAMDFMKSCFLCKLMLGQGLDIYMYRGDKAFCSAECRYHQIILDERAERRGKCSSAARSNRRSRITAASTIAAA